MENDFDYKLVPSGFVHCFNSQCPKADGCLRQEAARYSAHADRHIRIVNPAYFPVGDAACPDFRSAKKVRIAWGITNLLEKVPYRTARHLRKIMIFHFTKTLYYRYYRKEWHSAGSPALYPETFPAAWCRGGTGVRFLYGRIRMVKKALSALQAVLGVSRSFKSWNLKFLHMEQIVSIHETLGSIA